MMGRRLHHNRSGAAAVEMALVTPLLLTILIGSVELGHFFYNEHILVKSVRDGARFAARQGFSNYDCTGEPSATVRDSTIALVRTMVLTGGENRLAGTPTINVTEACATTATDDASATENMAGIYRGSASGAPVVTVSASVTYAPIIGSAFGFSGIGYTLNASQEAAVMGL
jgi:Flp pilus assembly protein TadG